MEDYWRKRMGDPPRRSAQDFGNIRLGSGVPSFPAYMNDGGDGGRLPRRSADHSLGRKTQRHRAPDPGDFSDVFGGPPRNVFANNSLSRGYGFDFGFPSSAVSENLYRDVFLPNEVDRNGGGVDGRSLKSFRIPEEKDDGFYDDVFGVEIVRDSGLKSKDRLRPKSNPKSNSSEEISPSRPPASCDDISLSSSTSKLRPINVTCRRNSTKSLEEQAETQEACIFSCNSTSAARKQAEDHHAEDFRRSIKISRQVSSPETISLEPPSHPSFKATADFMDLNSPVSPVSSPCQPGMHHNAVQDDDCEVMGSYVIEINSDRRDGTDAAVSIEDAIAWAKEKFQSHSFDLQPPKDISSDLEDIQEQDDFVDDGDEKMQTISIEMQLLDEDVRSWSAGKESNIRLLLSTLHVVSIELLSYGVAQVTYEQSLQLLWPSSGWYAIPLSCLKENSQVKKAYQRARLCLHPDKLQQRGVTFPQKYVAEKAFPILQEAWATYISRDALFS